MAETLRDYLVTLGFKVEKGEEARFNATLASLAKTMAGIAAGLTAAAATISGTVMAVSSSLDKLYFASQRTGASVASMRSLSYALSQVGGSSEQAMGAFEGLATALRTNPGTEGLLNSLGIVTRSNGKLKETGDLLDDIVSTLPKKFSYSTAAPLAAMLGIGDEKSWNTLVTQWPKIREFQRQQAEASKSFGVDPDKAAAASRELMQAFRQLLETVSLMTDKIVVQLQPKLTKILQDLQEWFREHQTDIVQAVDNVIGAIKGLVDVFGNLVVAMKPVVDTFGSLAKTLTGDDNSLKLALESIALYMAGAWLTKILGVFRVLGGAWGAVAALAGAGLFSVYKNPTGQTAFATADGVMPGMGATPGPDDMRRPGEDGGAGTRRGWGRLWNWVTKPFRVGQGGPSASAIARGTLAKITSKSGQVAWVAKEDAPQFQGFINDLEGTGYEIKDLGGFSERMIAGTNTPSHHGEGRAIDINPKENDIGKGTGDLPANTADLAKKWGLGWGALWRSKNDPMHFSTAPNEGGRRLTPEELNDLTKLRDKSSSLMAPAPLGGNTSRSASLNQKTDITIIGSSDPAGSAATLGGAQSRLGAELIRNAQSAVG